MKHKQHQQDRQVRALEVRLLHDVTAVIAKVFLRVYDDWPPEDVCLRGNNAIQTKIAPTPVLCISNHDEDVNAIQ